MDAPAPRTAETDERGATAVEYGLWSRSSPVVIVASVVLGGAVSLFARLDTRRLQGCVNCSDRSLRASAIRSRTVGCEPNHHCDHAGGVGSARVDGEPALEGDERLRVIRRLQRVHVGAGLDLPADAVLERAREQRGDQPPARAQRHRAASPTPGPARGVRRAPGSRPSRPTPTQRARRAERRCRSARRRGARGRARGRPRRAPRRRQVVDAACRRGPPGGCRRSRTHRR